MQPQSRLIVIRESHHINAGLAEVLKRDTFQATVAMSCQDGLARLQDVKPAAVIIDCATSTPPGGPAAFERLLDILDPQGIACLLLHHSDAPLRVCVPDWVQVLDYDTCADELFGRLASIQHYRQIVRRAQIEMHHTKRLDQHLYKQFAEVDQDLRLASRLQQEFLPRTLPKMDRVKFSVIYRPASWVSGDTYDVARVDEQHLSFYIADAVGHGMAASLLTMFVRRAIRNKEVHNQGYRILSPSRVLAELNDALAAEKLMNSQFVTACYCLLNHHTLELTLARGGHPYPLLVEPDGSVRELKAEGGLLGLFPGQEFPSQTLQLRPGQKIILFSDGMELTFVEDRDPETDEPQYQREFQKLAHLPAAKLTERLEQILDNEEGSINRRDDVTILVLELPG